MSTLFLNTGQCHFKAGLSQGSRIVSYLCSSSLEADMIISIMQLQVHTSDDHVVGLQ